MNKFDQEIWKEIEDATEDINVPESLLPENIVEKLKLENRKEKKRKMRKVTEIAAAAAVVMAIGGVGANYVNNVPKYESSMSIAEESCDSAAMDSGAGMDESVENGVIVEADSVDKATVMSQNSGKLQKKKKVGDIYHIAESYDEIYKKLDEYRNPVYWVDDEGGVIVEDAVANDSINAGSSAMGGSNEGMREENSAVGSAPSGSTADKGDKEFSSTNLQEEGVDESDIVKTDGKYVYRVWKNKVFIVDIQKNKMKTVGTINVKKSVSDTVKEIYLDGDKLCVVTQCLSTKLNKGEKVDDGETLAGGDEVYALNGIYQMNSSTSTKISVYNIANRKAPVLEGEMEQDGSYYTSRKVNDVMYLFTQKYVNRYAKDEVNVIPYIQGKQVEADCIYIPENYGASQLIVASVNMNRPEKVVDHMVVMNASAEVYMGPNAFYLYQSDYQAGQSYTNIAKFKYEKDGTMNGVNATSVKGDIEDTFAISEKNNSLRVLTTDWSKEDRVNQLYILDNNLKLKGEIEDIAKGESIYAARYIGNMAYFITYRNTDPLFVADLSNEKKPKLLGSVKISGFSDYLHPYGENKLLGIGYETDEDSRRLGVKICMFDISNPKKPKVLDSYVMKEADETPAAYNYKCALVDPKKNLIGFLVEDYDSSQLYTYKTFSWKNGKFKSVFTKKMKKNQYIDVNEARGIYSGNRFYILKNGVILSYEMKGKYKKIDSIKLK